MCGNSRARIKADIAAHVGASERMVQSYLADIDKDLREARSARIFSLWMQCWTQAEIANDVELGQPAVASETGELSEIEALRKTIKLPDGRAGERCSGGRPLEAHGTTAQTSLDRGEAEGVEWRKR
jgi:hypothetical protein